MTFGFCGPTYQGASVNHNAERCINLFPEITPGKSKVLLRGTPGANVLATLPASPVRGIWAGDNVVYAVGGGNFYKVTIGGVVTLQGALNAATTPAEIVSNGIGLLICSGDEVFYDDGTGPASVLTDGFVSIAFLDGYFLALQNPTATNGATRDAVFISDLYDGTTWNPLDFQERQGSSDRLVKIRAHNQQLWLIGQQTTEAWYNSGNPDFPFERIQGSQCEWGALPWTVATLDKDLFFVITNDEGSGTVVRASGFVPQRISNHAVEHALRNIGPTSIPLGYSYSEGGHGFYCLRLPSGPTWVYDTATKMWHERAVWDGSDWDPHPAGCAAHLYAHAYLLGAADSGKIYLQSSDIYTFDSAAIRRYRQAPHVVAEGTKRVFHSSLQLDMEMGTQSLGTPTALMKYSDDGGHTYTNNKTVNLGAPNAFTKRAIWRRLGESKELGRIYGVTLPDLDTGPVAIVDAMLDAQQGK